MINKEALPKHWRYEKLGNLCQINLKVPLTFPPETKVQFVPMRLIEENTNNISLTETIELLKVNKSSYTQFINGDILFAKVTPCMENGKVAIANNLMNGLGYGSSELHIIRCGEMVCNKFIYYCLKRSDFIREAKNEMTGAVGLRRVPKNFLENYEIPLPPIEEQREIVAKIEALLSELESAKQQLLQAREQLKLYRQSLLNAAFTGKLTNPNLQPGTLPDGWKWVKLETIVESISDGDHQPPPKTSTGVPFITISNINKKNYSIDFNECFYVSREYYLKLQNHRKPRTGDILYTVTGSFGIPILLNNSKEFCFQRHIGIIRPISEINQRWLYYALMSPSVSKQAKQHATGTAQKTVALKSLRGFQVPYCSLNEQALISEILYRVLTISDKMEESISKALIDGETLKQSILQQAFEGKLR